MAKDSLRFTRRLMLAALVFTPAVFAADRFYDEKGRYTGQNRGAAMTPRAATRDARILQGAATTRRGATPAGRIRPAGVMTRRGAIRGARTPRAATTTKKAASRGVVIPQGAAMTPRAATSGAVMTRVFKNETGPKTGRQSTSVLRL